MKLGEFIEAFSHNNIIRLHYVNEGEGGGNICVLENFDQVSMDWEVNLGKGKYARYKNHEVIKLLSICTDSKYPEAINILIERKPTEDIRDEVITEILQK